MYTYSSSYDVQEDSAHSGYGAISPRSTPDQPIRRFFKEKLWKKQTATLSWLHSLFLSIEQLAIWKKLAIVLGLTIPLIITGLLTHLIGITILGAVLFSLTLSLAGITAYYKHRRTHEDQQLDLALNELEDETTAVLNELAMSQQQANHYHLFSLKEGSRFRSLIEAQRHQQKMTNAQLADLTQRNTTLSCIGNSLASENKSLGILVAEQGQLLSAQQSTIQNLELSTKEKENLQKEIKSLLNRETKLLEHIRLLSQAAQQDKELIKSHTQKLTSLFKQRHYLVKRLKEGKLALDDLRKDNHQLRQELQFAQTTHEKMVLNTQQLTTQQLALRERISKLNKQNLDLLGSYQALDKMYLFTLHEVDCFRKQNVLLAERIRSLDQQRAILTEQVSSLSIVEKELLQVKDRMHGTISDLEQQITRQGEQISARQNVLEQTLNDYQQAKKNLDTTLCQLAEVQEQIKAQAEKAKKTQQILQTVISGLSQHLLEDKEKRAAFLQKLEHMISADEQSTVKFTTFITEISKNIALLVDELSTTIADQRQLAVRQNEYVSHLEELIKQPGSKSSTLSLSFFSAGTQTEPSTPPQILCLNHADIF